MKKTNFSLVKLKKAKGVLDDEMQKVETQIKPYIDFDFFLDYQPSDGFVIVHTNNAHNAILSKCISIIQDKGFLNYEDYLDECI